MLSEEELQGRLRVADEADGKLRGIIAVLIVAVVLSFFAGGWLTGLATIALSTALLLTISYIGWTLEHLVR